jgi:phage terminase large subunit
MFITLVQRVRSEIRIIEEMEDSHKTLDWYSAELKKKNYNWGFVFLPHDGFSKDYKSGKSTEEILTALGWHVLPRREIVEMSIEEGIKATRLVFRQMYFNKPKTERLVQCLKRYRRSINQTTNEPGVPFHDEWSHGADNVRYVAINAESMTNEEYYEEDDDDQRNQGRGIGGY